MSGVADGKTCKMCGMEIPALARRCPYCQHWQNRYSRIVRNPLMPILVVVVLGSAYAATMSALIQQPMKEWERFSDHSDRVSVTESRLVFGQSDRGPTVAVLGKVHNRSPVTWKEVRFQVDFFDPEGRLFDTGQPDCHGWWLPGEEESAFKVSVQREFPEKKYVGHKVRILSGKDSRERF